MSIPAPVPSQASLRIFVSHSHADDVFGLRLVADLQARLGEDAVWYDSSGGLHGGDEWWNHIVAELTARDTFIAIFSPDSVVSKWVIDEINIAWALRHRIGTRIIPILARPCDLRSDWLLLQYVSFVAPRPYDEAFAELLGVLAIPSEQVAPPAPVVAAAPPTPLAQLVERLTQEIHAAFGQEEWRTVLEKSDLLLQEELQGMSPALWRERGLAYLALGDSQSALGALDEALQVDSFDIATLRGKGLALQHSGRGTEAIEVLERAYQLAPLTDPLQRLSLLGDLAGVERGESDWSGVLRRVDQALRLSPDDPVWLRAKLEALAQLGREEEANALARDLAPRHLDVVNQWLQERYQHHLQEEEWPPARTTVETGLAVAPGSRVWQQAQVEVARRSGQVEEALTLARDMTASPGATKDEWISLAALAATANREEEVKTALDGAAAASGSDDAAVAQARKDYLVPFEAARKRTRTRQISVAVVAVSVLLIMAAVIELLNVNGARLQAEADATATAGQIEIATSNAEDATTATAEAVTATAAANATYAALPLIVYSAVIPSACGSDPNSWSNSILGGATVTCSSAGANVTTTSNFVDGTTFQGGSNQVFAFSFTVEVDITQLSPGACAGIVDAPFTTEETDFFVCDDGSWAVDTYSNGTVLTGKIAVSPAYHLEAVVGRNKAGLSINGSHLKTTTNPGYTGVGVMEEGILLGAEISSSAPSTTTYASATFGHFVYTPLPFSPSS